MTVFYTYADSIIAAHQKMGLHLLMSHKEKMLLSLRVSIAAFLLLLGAQVNAGGPMPHDDELDAIKHIKELPELSGDKEYWEIVKKGKEAIPFLISVSDDETFTEVVVSSQRHALVQTVPRNESPVVTAWGFLSGQD